MKIKMTIIVDSELEDSPNFKQDFSDALQFLNGNLTYNSNGHKQSMEVLPIGKIVSIQDVEFLTPWKKFN